MSELITDEAIEEAGVHALVSQHWDGTGCGTHGTNACVNCFGPSPYTAREVAREVLRVAEPLIAARALLAYANATRINDPDVVFGWDNVRHDVEDWASETYGERSRA